MIRKVLSRHWPRPLSRRSVRRRCRTQEATVPWSLLADAAAQKLQPTHVDVTRQVQRFASRAADHVTAAAAQHDASELDLVLSDPGDAILERTIADVMLSDNFAARYANGNTMLPSDMRLHQTGLRCISPYALATVIADQGEGLMTGAHVAAFTLASHCREMNQDVVGMIQLYSRDETEEPVIVQIVADGVGGSFHGEWAARDLAVTLIEDLAAWYCGQGIDEVLRKVDQLIPVVHQALLRRCFTLNSAQPISTTALVSVSQGPKGAFFWVGDSIGALLPVVAPAHHWRSQRVTFTMPHSIADGQVRPTDEIDVLTSEWSFVEYVVGGTRCHVDVCPFDSGPYGAWLALGTDGAWDGLGIGNIAQALYDFPLSRRLGGQATLLFDLFDPLVRRMQKASGNPTPYLRIHSSGLPFIVEQIVGDNCTFLLRWLPPEDREGLRAMQAQGQLQRALSLHPRFSRLAERIRSNVADGRYLEALQSLAQEVDPVELIHIFRVLGVLSK